MLQFLYRASDEWRHRALRKTQDPGQAAGRRGEDLAQRYLQCHGMTVVARNWRPEGGEVELDLVAWEFSHGEGTLVFVEVKARQTADFGTPDRAVDEEKRRHLLRAARSYARIARVPWEKTRFDVVSVVFGPPLQITHLRSAFAPHEASERHWLP